MPPAKAAHPDRLWHVPAGAESRHRRLTGPLDSVKRQCGEYQARRDALCGGLRSIGWNVPDSHGSMFVWAPLPTGYTDSMAFCLELIDKAGVICTPGFSFGPSGEGYVRLP